MILTESKSLSPVDLDTLITTMKRHTVEKQKQETLNSESTSVGKRSVPAVKSHNVRKKTKISSDIGPSIAVLAEGTRQHRASSFNSEDKKSKKIKKLSFDGSLSPEKSSADGQQDQGNQNDQHLGTTTDAHSRISPDIMITYDTVEDLPVLTNNTEFVALNAELPKKNVTLTLSTETITIQDVSDNKIIRRKKLTEIASCTQVS